MISDVSNLLVEVSELRGKLLRGILKYIYYLAIITT